MIDTAEQTTCLACGSPIIQIAGRGHRQRLYCDDLCRQRAHRKRSSSVTPGVTFDAQARIAELEAELEQTRQGRDQVQEQLRERTRTANDRESYFAGELARYRKASQQNEASTRIAKLEGELAEANELVERLLAGKKTTTSLKKSYQERLTRWGERLDWPALDIHITIKPGRKNWRVFMLNESNDQLIRAIIAAERVIEKRP